MNAGFSRFRRSGVDVTLYYGCHALAALLLSLPVTALVAGTGIGRFPEGDRLLFESGGLHLTEALRVLAPFATSHARLASVAFVALGVLLLLPHAALLVRLADPERSRASAWGRAAACFPPMLLLGGAALLAQVLVVLGASTLGASLETALTGATTRAGDLAYLSSLAVGALAAAAIGVIRDLCRAMLVLESSLDARGAFYAGLRAFSSAPVRPLLRWAAPAGVGLLLLLSGAAATQALDVSRPGDFRVAVVALLHQSVAYALCWCRTSWFASSLSIASKARAGR